MLYWNTLEVKVVSVRKYWALFGDFNVFRKKKRDSHWVNPLWVSVVSASGLRPPKRSPDKSKVTWWSKLDRKQTQTTQEILLFYFQFRILKMLPVSWCVVLCQSLKNGRISFVYRVPNQNEAISRLFTYTAGQDCSIIQLCPIYKNPTTERNPHLIKHLAEERSQVKKIPSGNFDFGQKEFQELENKNS